MKKPKFIRLHGAGDNAIISIRSKRVVAITDIGGRRIIKVDGGPPLGYEVYDETHEIIALIDGRKRVKDQKDADAQ